MLLLGLQHMFAMFGATVLVPLLTGMDPAVALLCAGVGTWIFHLCTGRKVPTYLGSSFAFIAAIQGAAMICGGADAVGTEAYKAGLPYATGGILVAGALYLVLALLVRFVGVERVRSFFPPIITGPIVTIIGLMLAPTAISNITTQIGSINVGLNWLVAAIAIATIFIVSLFAKGIFKLVPILIGIVVGYIAAICCGMVNFSAIAEANWIQLPAFFLPKFDMRAIGLIAPIAIVTFVEHIGDVNASSAVCGKDFIKDPGLHRTLMGDGLATMFAGLVGGPANTTYSENTGVLAATKNYNPLTLEIAACIAIVLAFFGKFSALISAMPGPVLGGVSVVLYGMIAAVGLRTLVENKVDFTKSRNLLIAAVMLVLGLGANGAIVIGGVSISGVALAAVLGIILNKVLPESIEKD
ncbi:MAG: uracil-xanthine permease family protein [Candidatus Spyradocola sp.]